jgi:cysteine protease ATG4
MAAPERTRSRSSHPESPSVPAPVQEGTTSDSTKWFASAYTEAQLRTFHCDKIKKIPLSNVDPSMLLGFLCKNEADFEDLCQRVNKVSLPFHIDL